MKLFPSKRTAKRFALGCALLMGLLLVVNAFMSWRVDRQTAALIAEIRAAGDPATLADLKPAPIPDEENAAYWLKEARERLQSFEKDYSAFCDSEQGKSLSDQPPTTVQIVEMRKILQRDAGLSEDISRIANCEKYTSLADYSLSPNKLLESILATNIKDFRRVAWRQDWEIQILSAEGNHNAAINKARELLKIARLYKQEPLLVNYLTSVAINGLSTEAIGDELSTGRVSDQFRRAVDSELAKSVSLQSYIQTLKSERAFALSHDWQQSIAGFGPEFELNLSQRVLAKMFGWIWKRHSLVEPAEYMKRLISAIESQTEFPVKILSNPEFFSKLGGETVLINLMQPGLEGSFEAHCRVLAKSRALRVFSALQYFEQTAGRVATGLADLDLPSDATTDPYAGEPLKLKHSEHGWIVYSVGKNGVDDGGHVVDYADIGYAPPAVRLEQSKKD